MHFKIGGMRRNVVLYRSQPTQIGDGINFSFFFYFIFFFFFFFFKNRFSTYNFFLRFCVRRFSAQSIPMQILLYALRWVLANYSWANIANII